MNMLHGNTDFKQYKNCCEVKVERWANWQNTMNMLHGNTDFQQYKKLALSRIYVNTTQNLEFFKSFIYVRSCHFDYSPRVPKKTPGQTTVCTQRCSTGMEERSGLRWTLARGVNIDRAEGT